MIILKMPAFSAAGCLILILNILRESFLQSPTSTIFTSALPVTSKPIDGTAEKLAWQAWVKLPQEQKKQEKTRKVTPKSIFTLPVRNCPLGYKELESRCNNDCVPGQHVQSLCVKDCPLGYTDDNLRCILECAPDQPTKDCTFSIDPEELIKLELDFIAGTSVNEYDYDDDETQTDFIPQKLSAETVVDLSNNTFQKATLDEPLKFNIFEQKFPTDYGNGGTVIEDEMLEFDNNTQTLYESSTLLTINRDDTSPNLNVTKTLSSFTKNITNSNETNSKESLRLESTDHSDLSSIINVKSVPAGPTAPTANTGVKENEHYLLINDDSSIQIIQSSVTSQNEHKRVYPTLQEEMHQLFKDDQLLALNNGNLFKINQNQVKNFTRNYTGDTFYEESVAETSKPIILVDNIRLQAAHVTVSENTGGIKSKEKQSSGTVDTENESKKNEHTRSLTTSKLSPEVYGQTPALDFTTTEPESTTNTELPETNTEEYNAPTTLLLEVVSEYPLTQSGFIKFSDGETHTVQKKANVDSVEEREGPTSASSKNTSAFATQTRKDVSLASVLFPLARYSASHTQITTTLPTRLHQQNDRFYYENFQDNISHDLSNTDTQPPTNEKDIIDQKRSSNLLNENEKNFDLTNPVTASSSQPLTTTVDINTTDEENVNKELRIINELVKIKHKPSETTTVTARGLNQFNSLNEKSSSLGVNVLQTTLKPYTSSKGLRTSGENGYYPSQITAGAISTPPTQTKISLSSKKTAALNESLNLNKTSGAVEENLSLRTSNDKEAVLSSARNLRNSKIIRNKTVIPPNAVDERISAKQVLNEKGNVNSSSTEKTSTTEENSPTFDPFWWLPVGWQLDSAPQTKNDSMPFFFKFWSVLPDVDSQSSSNTQTPK